MKTADFNAQNDVKAAVETVTAGDWEEARPRADQGKAPTNAQESKSEVPSEEKGEVMLFGFMEGIITKLKEAGKVRTAETYGCALRSFRRYRDGNDIPMADITPAILEDYQTTLAKRGVKPNTSSFYLRVLRAVFNKAVDDELIVARNPFKRVYMGVDKTSKRALPVETIKQIRTLDLSEKPAVAYARDIFMLSFYLRGMSFVDMAYLRKTDLKEGYVTYNRQKTGQQLTVKWTPEMQEIIDRYPTKESPYLLPIMDGSVRGRTRKPFAGEVVKAKAGKDTTTGEVVKEGDKSSAEEREGKRLTEEEERARYKLVGFNVNHNLKTVACKLGLTMALTLYVARHSWATAAKAAGIPLSTISDAMGHTSEATTRIYLKSLDTTEIDAANDKILQTLL